MYYDLLVNIPEYYYLLFYLFIACLKLWYSRDCTNIFVSIYLL